MYDYNNLTHFKFWCQKVLPLVYDDSLSYYEILCKVVDYINKLIDDDKAIIDNVNELKNELKEVQKWIEDFDTSFIQKQVEEYIAKISSGWFDFDLVIATPDMMSKIGRLGKTLGTKGLMPNPKSGTVTTDVEKTVQEFKKGKLAFKVDKLGSIHVPLGKANFGSEKIGENLKAFMAEIMKLKPAASKGQYLRTVALSLTMGPGIKIDPILVSKNINA